MISSARQYNENYYTNRKKILQDFLKDEETETMKYIDETETLVSNTKMILKGIVTNEFDTEQIKEKLSEIDNELTNDCANLEKELQSLVNTNKEIEQKTIELQKQEEKGTESYLQKIEKLKNELEAKEFAIQNMERIYVELEDIIKTNLSKQQEPILTLEEFDDFVSQNERIKKECEELEEEKNKLLKEYNNLLRENLNLKSKDESFEIEKIKDVLEEIATMGNLQKEAETRLQKLQLRYTQLTKECNGLTEQIRNITKTLEGLNIDNPRLNKEINIINKEIFPYEQRLNRSFTAMYENEEWKDVDKIIHEIKGKQKKIMRIRKNKHTKTSLI